MAGDSCRRSCWAIVRFPVVRQRLSAAGGTGRGRFATRSGQAVTIRDVALPEIPVRLDPPLLRALRRRADTEGVSLNELIRRLLRDGLREQDAGVVGPPPVEADHVGDNTLRRSA